MLKYLNSQHISTIKISASAIHFFITVCSQKKLFQNFLIQNILSLKKYFIKILKLFHVRVLLLINELCLKPADLF